MIAQGAFADLVLLDPARVADTATFAAPHSYPAGIDLVVVNGSVAWDGARGERAGRALRRAGAEDSRARNERACNDEGARPRTAGQWTRAAR